MNTQLKLVTVILLMTTSACNLFPERPALPALHDFGSVAQQTSSPSSSNTGTWSTVSVDAPEWLQNENICYRLLYADPSRVRFYTQDRWLASPTALLAQRLSLASNQLGWQLKIRLLAFEQLFDAPQQARVVLVFRATALPTTNSAKVTEKLFNLTLPSATADAKGALSASVQLVDEAVIALHSWLAELPTLP